MKLETGPGQPKPQTSNGTGPVVDGCENGVRASIQPLQPWSARNDGPHLLQHVWVSFPADLFASIQRGPSAMPKTKATREHPAGRCSGIGGHAAVERGRSPVVTSEDVAEIGGVSVDVRRARQWKTSLLQNGSEVNF